MANYMQIKDLPEVVTAADSDSLLIDTARGTKRIQKKNLAPTVETDPTPTEGSTKPVQSGGVYTELAKKMNNIPIDSAPIEDSPNLVSSGGVFRAMELYDRNIILTETLTAGSTTVVFSDEHLGSDYLISLFVDDININPTNSVHDKEHETLTLTFDKYPVNHVIKIKLEDAKYENYEGTHF